MTKFLVLFEGRKFVTTIDGRRQTVGFFANRGLDAASLEEVARTDAMETMAPELAAQGLVRTDRSSVQIVRACCFEDEHAQVARGFSFFPDGSFLERMRNLFRARRKPGAD